MKHLILIFFLSLNLFAQSELLTIMGDDKPLAPTSAGFVGAEIKGTLSWTNAASYDSIYVLRGTSTNPTTIVYRLAGNVTSKLDSPLTGGTIYYYRLRSKKSGVLSDYTTTVSDTAGYAEMLTNRNLETLTSGTVDDNTDDDWAMWGEGSLNSLLEATATSYSGIAAKFTNQATQSYVNAALQYLNIVVVAETNYRLTYYARGDGTNTGAHRIYSNTGAVNIVAPIENNTGITGTSYALKTVDFTTPAGCVLISIYFYMDGTNGSIVYVDDISLKRR